MKLFISVDLGTTSVKTAVIDKTGKLRSISLKEYTLHTPAENIVELDSETYWNCTGEPSGCDGICGDAKIRGTETCDDNNILTAD